MSLLEELKTFKENVLAGIPKETIDMMVRANEKLEASGIVNRALGKGDTMPPFSLPDIHGQLVESNDLLHKGPLIISFYRGSW